mmetsp:Transcript_19565/g.40343  ORF Transcript_19565/g.40343 Transcript_19565/m.40343 type:complete len:264 (-) Transcript_19565:248-1039(-)
MTDDSTSSDDDLSSSSDSDSEHSVSKNHEATTAKPPIHDDDDDDAVAGVGDDVVNLKLSIVDSYGDKGEYDGGVLQSTVAKDTAGNPSPDAVPSTLGTMNYSDGRVYSGEWENGRWHGRGKTTYPNGDSYEGDYRDDQRDGKGVYHWNDGRRFEGDFANDQRNGHGVYSWPDGSTYEGEFRDGRRHGKGTYSVSTAPCATCCWNCWLVLYYLVLRRWVPRWERIQRRMETGISTRDWRVLLGKWSHLQGGMGRWKSTWLRNRN